MNEQEAPDPRQLWQQLTDEPQADPLARLVRTVALSAADERRPRLGDGLDEVLAEAELEVADGDTSFGNVIEALQSGEAPNALGVALGGLLARGLALAPPDDAPTATRLATGICWLSAHTPVDALPFLDEALGPQSELLWAALAEVVRSSERGADGATRALAMTAATAIATADSSPARAALEALRAEVGDPSVSALLRLAAPADAASAVASRSGARPTEATLEGELVPGPLRAVWLVLWAITGLLFVRVALRLLAALVLRLRRPVRLQVTADGITVSSRVTLVGKTVRTRETHIPLANLARAVREVRYPRLPTYVGLLALAAGSFAGASLAIDGFRAGSPALLGVGLALLAGGVLLDLLFGVLLPGRSGKCRLIFVPRKGAMLALSTKNATAADEALQTLQPRR